MDALWKRQQISHWLEQMFGDEEVPEYELNETTISHLYEMSTVYQKNNKNLEYVIEDIQQKTEEYNAEAQRLKDVLARMSLGTDLLTKPGNTSLLTLARLAQLLNIKDSSDSSYLLALQSLDNELYKTERLQAEEEKKLKALTDSSKRAIDRAESLKKTIDLVNQKTSKELKMANERMKDETPFFKKKTKAYAKDIAKLQIKQQHIDPNISHEALIKKSEKLDKLKLELEPLKEELNAYMVLPPNLSETKILIQQKKNELDLLEKQLSAQCEGIQL